MTDVGIIFVQVGIDEANNIGVITLLHGVDFVDDGCASFLILQSLLLDRNIFGV